MNRDWGKDNWFPQSHQQQNQIPWIGVSLILFGFFRFVQYNKVESEMAPPAPAGPATISR